jgi:rhomboid protease GluP
MTPAPSPSGVDYAVITAHSKRQAMDWSLVLVSQGIEPIIEFDAETRKWELLVLPQEFDKSEEAIRQYRLENRGWGWRHELPGSQLEIHAGAVFWCFFLIGVHWLATEVSERVQILGQMDSALARQGQWWRLFTAVLLHSDLGHLMANVTFGIIMLGLAMARFGVGWAILLAYLGGVLGNVAGLAVYPRPYRGVGSSGMMMAALGLLCVHSVALWRKSPKAARYISSGVAAGFLLFVWFGLNPASDIVAHAGGFFSGLIFGLILSWFPEKTLHSPRPNQCALALLIALITSTAALALR